MECRTDTNRQSRPPRAAPNASTNRPNSRPCHRQSGTCGTRRWPGYNPLLIIVLHSDDESQRISSTPGKGSNHDMRSSGFMSNEIFKNPFSLSFHSLANFCLLNNLAHWKRKGVLAHTLAVAVETCECVYDGTATPASASESASTSQVPPKSSDTSFASPARSSALEIPPLPSWYNRWPGRHTWYAIR